MAFDTGDQQTAQDWLAQEAQWMNEPEDERIEKPIHNLDAETVRALVLLVLPPVENHVTNVRLKTAFKRFLILAALIDDSLAARGLGAIAKALTEIGLTTSRASLSQLHVALADIVGIHRLGRSDAARESYRQSAKKVWSQKKKAHAL